MLVASGFDRVKAAFKRQYADCIPSYPILGASNTQLTNISIKEFLTDSNKFAESQIKSYYEFEPDVVVMMADLLMEAEAIGTALEFLEDQICQIKEHLLENKKNLATLKIPNPETSARLPYYLDACQKVSEAKLGSPVGCVICGPWAIAVALRGAQNIIFDTVDDPEFVKNLMNFTVEVVKIFAKSISARGVGVSLSEAPASCSLISPKIYQEFIAPYHKQLVEYFKILKIGLTLHVCGFIDPIMEPICELGFAAVSIDNPSSLKKMFELNKGRAVIIGNVATSLFSEGSPNEMEDAVKNCLQIAQGHPEYILASGCETPANSSIEQIRTFMKAARKYGCKKS